MPLHCLSAEQAFENRRLNDCAYWPQRGESNRIEPIARLKSRAPFTIAPQSSVFTVGSCFARNIEGFLQSAGFKVPMLDLLRLPEFAKVPTEAINNYSAPSVYNEFFWALETDGAADPDRHFLKTSDGNYIDLHLGAHQKPLPLEIVMHRRQMISQVYRTVTECETIILTLGLSEVWYDTIAGCYVNHTPLPNVIRMAPGRFELHVLSYEDVKTHIFAALELLEKHCTRRPNLILTVSPVPLMTTFRPTDVAVSNSYSKAVLRTVAEEAESHFDFATYFPSYESVTLSDRAMAWMADQVHVTQGIVAVQVARMLRSFAPHVKLADLEGLVEAEIVDRAKSFMTPLEAQLFYQEFGERLAHNAEFLACYIKFLLSQREVQKAKRLSLQLPQKRQEDDLLRAKSHRLGGAAEEALAAIEHHLGPNQRSQEVWEESILCHAASGNTASALAVMEQFCKVMPWAATVVLARLSRDMVASNPAVARQIAAKATVLEPSNAIALGVLAELDGPMA